ncbi:FixJ family two-component response regulator [Paraburkholderia atlantica]|uniref:response regulator transcription factor n=1 Tax=Paraburkholderia atlantica TaxID=2654982 RepID=UPI003D2533D3
MEKNTFPAVANTDGAIVYVIDDDASLRSSLSSLLRSCGYSVRTFEGTRDFISAEKPGVPSCLLLDVRLQGESGLTFQLSARRHQVDMPIIVMTAHGDIEMSVEAMKAGAIDFLTKPVREQRVIDAVSSAIGRHAEQLEKSLTRVSLMARYDTLTVREREVIWYVVKGFLNKQIAAEMNLSEITIKMYRGSAMKKLEALSLPDLIRKTDIIKGCVSTKQEW